MSMVPNSKLDYQWSVELQQFCVGHCPHGKDHQQCIGVCKEGLRLVMREMLGDKASAPVPVQVTKHHHLIVLERIGDKESQVVDFDLEQVEREQFLPEWRAIGEQRLQFLKG